MTRWGILFLALGTTAWAAAPPIYPTKIEAVLVHGLFEKSTARLHAGQAEECESKIGGDWMTYRCKASSAQLTVARAGSSPVTFSFDSVFVWYRTYKNRMLREYVFSGAHREAVGGVTLGSSVKLSIYHYDDDREKFYGVLDLHELGVSDALQGAAAP